VFPAVTTQFAADGSVDLTATQAVIAAAVSPDPRRITDILNLSLRAYGRRLTTGHDCLTPWVESTC
jgi:hypothetical protein